MANSGGNPAEELVGQVINQRWKITDRKNLEGKDTTGGFFPFRMSSRTLKPEISPS